MFKSDSPNLLSVCKPLAAVVTNERPLPFCDPEQKIFHFKLIFYYTATGSFAQFGLEKYHWSDSIKE